MKRATLIALCLLFATAAFGQSSGGSVLTAEPQVFRPPDHSQRAAQMPMGQPQTLLENNSSFFVEGERPLWEVQPAKHEVPLGDVARMLRKDHELVKKAEFVKND
jgi:hypothetical protein